MLADVRGVAIGAFAEAGAEVGVCAPERVRDLVAFAR
jgi:hypothetical protein